VILFFIDFFTPFGFGSLHLSPLCVLGPMYAPYNSLYSLQCQPICEGETVGVKVRRETHLCFSVLHSVGLHPNAGLQRNHSLVGEEDMSLQLRESR
jgi:hypothetical protein